MFLIFNLRNIGKMKRIDTILKTGSIQIQEQETNNNSQRENKMVLVKLKDLALANHAPMQKAMV